VGLPVAIRPVLRVTDGAGRPIPGVAVQWQIGSGGGGLRYGDPVTGADGTAGVVKWVLGTTAGVNTLVATVQCQGPCAPVVFHGTGVAGPVESIARIAGDGQSAAAGTAVATPPAVRIADGYGNAAANRTVTFEVIAGGGMVSSSTATSNGDGLATVGSWTLGPGPGTNQLRVTAEGVSVVFTATGN
jgi:adhesin/invasin